MVPTSSSPAVPIPPPTYQRAQAKAQPALHLDALTLVTRLHLFALCRLAVRLFSSFRLQRPPLCGWSAVARRVALTYAATIIVAEVSHQAGRASSHSLPHTCPDASVGIWRWAFVTAFVTLTSRKHGMLEDERGLVRRRRNASDDAAIWHVCPACTRWRAGQASSVWSGKTWDPCDGRQEQGVSGLKTRVPSFLVRMVGSFLVTVGEEIPTRRP